MDKLFDERLSRNFRAITTFYDRISFFFSKY